MAAGSSVEFDCCECGRHIVRIAGPLPDPLLCALCLMVPGWNRDPRLAPLLEKKMAALPGPDALPRPYSIAPDGSSILCHRCNYKSHHPRDVAERYCARCHVFFHG